MGRGKPLGEGGLGKAQFEGVGMELGLEGSSVSSEEPPLQRCEEEAPKRQEQCSLGLNPCSATQYLCESGAGHLIFMCFCFLTCQMRVMIKPVSLAWKH